jgi:hypothetical protein
VQLYSGDLMEGSYFEWCLQERDRLRSCCRAMLMKLTVYCQERRDFRRGVAYAERLLRLEPADERAHQELMRLHANGDRTAALRQFQRCKAALREELGVEPSRQTASLYQHLRADDGEPDARMPLPPAVGNPPDVSRLEQLLAFIGSVHEEVRNEIRLARESMQQLEGCAVACADRKIPQEWPARPRRAPRLPAKSRRAG